MDPARHRRAGSRPALGPGARVLSRLRRGLRPPRTLRPTRAGWCYFALTLGVGFAAMNTGNNLLYMVLSLFLAFLVLSGVLSESALRGIRVRRRLPREACAGTRAPVALEIENTQRRMASFAIVVEDLLGESPARARTAGRCFVLRVGPGERVTRSYGLVAERRGPLRFWGCRVATRFPFGLFSKAMLLEEEGELLVYPHLGPRPLRAGVPAAPQGRQRGGGRGGTSPEAAGLRSFVPGDPMRHVHWRSSLRRGELLVRDREREERAETRVHLDTRGAPEGARFEAEVERAASDVAAHLEAGYRVALRTDEVAFPAEGGRRQRRRLLAYLARVAPAPATPARSAERAAS